MLFHPLIFVFLIFLLCHRSMCESKWRTVVGCGDVGQFFYLFNVWILPHVPPVPSPTALSGEFKPANFMHFLLLLLLLFFSVSVSVSLCFVSISCTHLYLFCHCAFFKAQAMDGGVWKDKYDWARSPRKHLVAVWTVSVAAMECCHQGNGHPRGLLFVQHTTGRHRLRPRHILCHSITSQNSCYSIVFMVVK